MLSAYHSVVLSAMGRSVRTVRGTTSRSSSSSSSSSRRTSSIARWLQSLLILAGCLLCLAYDPEASITGLYTGPYFDPLTPKNHTAHLDDQAVLPCTVRQLGDKSVSWVRMRDADILTVDRYTFVGDERFESHYSTAKETWNLVIKYVQERDAGQYECQVSTEPKMSQLFSLRVVVPKVAINPLSDRYVKAGSQVAVDCQITDVVQLPDYIFWYHEEQRVMETTDSNIKVSMKKSGPESITSTLTIQRVAKEDSGNYTCMPSNLHAASVMLHVLNEEQRAAVSDGRNSANNLVDPKLQLLLILVLFVLIYPTSSVIEMAVNKEGCQEKTKKDCKDENISRISKSQNTTESFSFTNESERNDSLISENMFPLYNCCFERFTLSMEPNMNEKLLFFSKSFQTLVFQNNEYLHCVPMNNLNAKPEIEIVNIMKLLIRLLDFNANNVTKDIKENYQINCLNSEEKSREADINYVLFTKALNHSTQSTYVALTALISDITESPEIRHPLMKNYVFPRLCFVRNSYPYFEQSSS